MRLPFPPGLRFQVFLGVKRVAVLDFNVGLFFNNYGIVLMLQKLSISGTVLLHVIFQIVLFEVFLKGTGHTLQSTLKRRQKRGAQIDVHRQNSVFYSCWIFTNFNDFWYMLTNSTIKF